MKQKKHMKWWVLVSAFLLTFLSACGGQPTSQSQEQQTTAGNDEETIKIGVVTSLSGAYAVIGNEVLEAVQFAVDERNEQGGVLGKRLEVIAEDDEGKADTGLRKAEKMVTNDGVQFIMGSVSSAVGLAIGAKMPEWNGIYISTVNKTPKLTKENYNDHIFRVNHNDLQDMATIRAWYEKNNEATTWYMIGADYEWGHSSLSEFRKIVEENGHQILGEAYTPLGTKDYSSQITNMLSAQPEGVWVALSGSDGINFLKQARSFGLTEKTQIVTFLTDLIINAVTTDALGVIGNVNYHYSLDNPKNREFVANFEQKLNKKPSNYHGETYIACQFLFEAIEKAGTTDTKQVISAMEGLTLDSPLGKITMRADDHQMLHPNYMGEVVDENGNVTIKVIYESTPEEANTFE